MTLPVVNMCPLGRIEACWQPPGTAATSWSLSWSSRQYQKSHSKLLCEWVQFASHCAHRSVYMRQWSPWWDPPLTHRACRCFDSRSQNPKFFSPPMSERGWAVASPVEQLVWTRTGFQCRLRRVSRRWSWGPPMRHPRSLRAMTGSSSKLWTWHVSSTQPSTALCPLDGIPRALWTQTFARSLPWHVWFAASPSVNKRPRNMMHHTSVHIKTRVFLLVHFDSSTRADS